MLKKGIIKLLPKFTFCTALTHWRPITMMGILYKIFAKALSVRLNPFLRASVHTSQSGFVGGRSIYDNILAVQLGIEYAQRSGQDTVLLQLDFQNAFDSLDWSFGHATMGRLGFGPRMASVMYLLGANSQSSISLNGYITDPIPI